MAEQQSRIERIDKQIEVLKLERKQFVSSTPRIFRGARMVKGGLWHERHPQRVKNVLKDLGMSSPYAELRCPRCKVLLKPDGIPIHPQHISSYYGHLGSSRCTLIQKEPDASKRRLSYASRILDIPYQGPPPLCACGCGAPVTYSLTFDRWNKYVNHHKDTTQSRKKIDLINEGEHQDDLGRRLGINARDSSRLAHRLVKLGLLRRVKVLHDKRWTYQLFKVGIHNG